MDIKAHHTRGGLQDKLWMGGILEGEAADVANIGLIIEAVRAKTNTY